VNNIKYADDIVLVTTTPTELQKLLNRIRIAGKKYGLLINKGSTLRLRLPIKTPKENAKQ